jgi:hypothetical protein
MGLLTAGVADVSSLVVPSPPYPAMTALPCSEHELLQLSALHLTLSPTAEATAGECA